MFVLITLILWEKHNANPLESTLAVVSILLLGFISSFNQAVIIHAAQGFSNSNTAIVRTLVSEVVQQKRWATFWSANQSSTCATAPYVRNDPNDNVLRFQARAFVLLPICTSVATILGPLIAGLTVEAEPEPQGNHQSLLETYPYALPALINSTITLVSLLATFFFLEEVSTFRLLCTLKLTIKDLRTAAW